MADKDDVVNEFREFIGELKSLLHSTSPSNQSLSSKSLSKGGQRRVKGDTSSPNPLDTSAEKIEESSNKIVSANKAVSSTLNNLNSSIGTTLKGINKFSTSITTATRSLSLVKDMSDSISENIEGINKSDAEYRDISNDILETIADSNNTLIKRVDKLISIMTPERKPRKVVDSTSKKPAVLRSTIKKVPSKEVESEPKDKKSNKLGGASAIKRILGGLGAAWLIKEIGLMNLDPGNFLGQIGERLQGTMVLFAKSLTKRFMGFADNIVKGISGAFGSASKLLGIQTKTAAKAQKEAAELAAKKTAATTAKTGLKAAANAAKTATDLAKKEASAAKKAATAAAKSKKIALGAAQTKKPGTINPKLREALQDSAKAKQAAEKAKQAKIVAGKAKQAKATASKTSAASKAALKKQVAKTAGKSIVKKSIPFVGAGISWWSAAKRAARGDFKGAALDAVSGAATFIPLAGGAISTAIDVGSAVRDIKNQEKVQKKAVEQAVEPKTPPVPRDPIQFNEPVLDNKPNPPKPQPEALPQSGSSTLQASKSTKSIDPEIKSVTPSMKASATASKSASQKASDQLRKDLNRESSKEDARHAESIKIQQQLLQATQALSVDIKSATEKPSNTTFVSNANNTSVHRSVSRSGIDDVRGKHYRV